ncbi:HAD domain-containing protein [Kitasatospora sp. NPDC058965]|uniref:HAD domain-containing protein n=1 Tax=Kitasatospora sp. NPDC058965 TaxID=3346682 RepID=UPI0036BA714E
MTPLIFLDVDGPLLPFGGPPGQYPVAGPDDPNPLLARLDPAHGPRLLALPGTLVWATTWEDEANDVLAPRLGLPRLPVVHWPAPDGEDDEEDCGPLGRHWKTGPLVARAAGRPFVWLDDEITAADRSWVARHHPAPALLHRVDPRLGLQPADYAAVTGWLTRLQA